MERKSGLVHFELVPLSTQKGKVLVVNKIIWMLFLHSQVKLTKPLLHKKLRLILYEYVLLLVPRSQLVYYVCMCHNQDENTYIMSTVYTYSRCSSRMHTTFIIMHSTLD